VNDKQRAAELAVELAWREAFDVLAALFIGHLPLIDVVDVFVTPPPINPIPTSTNESGKQCQHYEP